MLYCQFAEDIEVLKTTLEAVLPFFGWMPIGDVFCGEPGKDITDCLLKMLTNTQLRMDAAECLLTLAMRKVCVCLHTCVEQVISILIFCVMFLQQFSPVYT